MSDDNDSGDGVDDELGQRRRKREQKQQREQQAEQRRAAREQKQREREQKQQAEQEVLAAALLLGDVEEMPSPAEPMAVARVLLEGHKHDGHTTLVHWRGGWMRWQQTHWTEIEEATVRHHTALRLEHAVYRALDPKTQQVVLKPWNPNRYKLTDMVDALRVIVHLPEMVEAPSWLDDPSRPVLGTVACRNGILDAQTGRLTRLTPRFFNVVSVPLDYNPDAPEPTGWLKFLGELWDADMEAIEALQEWFGYILSGRTNFQKALLMVGPIRGGKGTVARTLTALLGGPRNVATPTMSALGTQFGLASLIGKPLAYVSDARTGKGGNAAALERILSITGEDVQTIPRKFKDDWVGRLSARLMLLSNETPQFSDASGAIVTRLIVLQLTESFLGHENHTLEDELLEELDGILLWALEGLARLTRRGHFVQPTSSDDAVRTMQDLVSPVAAFIRERCVRDPYAEIERKDLYDAYRQWAEENGYRIISSAEFGRNLHAAAFWVRDSHPHGQPRRYVGIALK
jgi:putative DNA primase/helicase